MVNSRLLFGTAFILMLASQHCFAGGVSLSSTRVIYDGSRKEASLTVNNKSANEEFLIQSWIDDVNGNKKHRLLLLRLCSN